MKDIRTTYKKSGYSWEALKHWKRRWLRDIRKLGGV